MNAIPSPLGISRGRWLLHDRHFKRLKCNETPGDCLVPRAFSLSRHRYRKVKGYKVIPGIKAESGIPPRHLGQDISHLLSGEAEGYSA